MLTKILIYAEIVFEIFLSVRELVEYLSRKFGRVIALTAT